MMRPARMTKLTILSSRQHLRPIIEKLYDMQSVHLVEFSEGRDAAMGEFRIGKPLPEGQQASERLVRLRSLSRHLDLEKHQPSTRHSSSGIEAKLDAHISQLEVNITSAVETKARIQSNVEALHKERALIEPLKALPLRLDDYHGYKSLAVFLGTPGDEDPSAALRQAVPQAEFFASPEGPFVAFVPKDLAGKAGEALARAGCKLTEAPKGTGTVAERIDAISREVQQLEHRLASATEDLARLRREHADFLVAAEEHLEIQAEKAEAPLAFATSEHAFFVECWVPEDQVNLVEASLREAAGNKFHVEVQRAEDVMDHAHSQAAHTEAHGGEAEAHAEPSTADIPPTMAPDRGASKPFRMFTEMVSVPRYDEIDPTPVLALVLPLFLGFMIGDAGYGVLMLLIGVWMIRKLAKGIPPARDVGIALAVAGGVSLFFGSVIFADAFGIPFGMHVAGETCAQFMVAHGETTWGCILGTEAVISPAISKLRDISDLLVISVLGAVVHMTLGLGFGIVNNWHHSKKHVVAKLGWLVLMYGFFAQIFFMAQGNRIAGVVYRGLGIPSISFDVVGVQFHAFLLGGILLAVILLAVGEGAMAVLELPSMLSNLLSYTRLAGLAVAKGAMAAAFTGLTLVAMVYQGPGGPLGLVLVVVGLVLFIFTQMFVFVLGVFSSGIQAIRLNFVEFFNKFYTGGGIPFTPFGKKRKYTQEA